MEKIYLEAIPVNELLETIREIIKEEITELVNQPAKFEKPLDMEAAEEFTRLERPTIYQLAQKGKIPSHKQGKKWYFYASELNEWIKKRNSEGQ